jgi:hypothetical protein
VGDTVTDIELTPVPDIVTVMAAELEGEFVFFPPELWVVTTIEPLSVPVDGGVNVTVHVTLCPPARVMG